MKTIVFIVHQLSQPRCIKRISTIQDAGFPIKVYGFLTEAYTENLKNIPFKIHETIKRDKSANKINKILSFRATIKRILKENKHDCIFYFFGFEIAAIAYFLGCRNYIYEEADVSAARINNNFIRKLLLSLDKRIIHKSKLTIFTSAGFVEYLFNNKCPQNVILQPNKLSPYFYSEQKRIGIKKDFNPDHLKFGFVGAIRYRNTIVRFSQVIGTMFPQHEFHFYGAVTTHSCSSDIDSIVNIHKNVFFHGSFRNPIDLPPIYENIDISIACYDTTSGNAKIAEPNKLYESIYFETPLVVSSGTFLARQVAKYDIGFCIDASNDDSIIDFVNQIKISQLQHASKNMHDINYKELVDTPEILIEYMAKISS